MRSDDELRRRLRSLESELEAGNVPLRPSRPDARRGVRMRPAAAGLGMAASIAATVALFAQVLPSQESGRLGTGSGGVASTSSRPSPSDPASPIGSPPPGEPAVPIEPIEPSPTPSRAPTSSPQPAPAACPEPGSRKAPGEGISITSEVSPSQARTGETVTLRAVFRNERSEPVSNDEGNPRADFVVYDAAGKPVWVFSYGKVFTQELRSATYAPGEEVAVETVWNLRRCGPDGADGPVVEPGTYRVRAIWSGPEGGWSGLTTLTVG